jgi:hypothetical protein
VCVCVCIKHKCAIKCFISRRSENETLIPYTIFGEIRRVDLRD